jgi:hypothetical protein
VDERGVTPGLVRFFGDDLGAEGFAEEICVAAGVLFQDLVVFADGLGFFLGSEGGFIDGGGRGGGAAGLLGGYCCFGGATFAGGLFAAIRGDIWRGCRCRGAGGLLVGLRSSTSFAVDADRFAVRSWCISDCDCRERGVPGRGSRTSTS